MRSNPGTVGHCPPEKIRAADIIYQHQIKPKKMRVVAKDCALRANQEMPYFLVIKLSK